MSESISQKLMKSPCVWCNAAVSHARKFFRRICQCHKWSQVGGGTDRTDRTDRQPDRLLIRSNVGLCLVVVLYYRDGTGHDTTYATARSIKHQLFVLPQLVRWRRSFSNQTNRRLGSATELPRENNGDQKNWYEASSRLVSPRSRVVKPRHQKRLAVI